jgi:hypothetical protein
VRDLPNPQIASVRQGIPATIAQAGSRRGSSIVSTPETALRSAGDPVAVGCCRARERDASTERIGRCRATPHSADIVTAVSRNDEVACALLTEERLFGTTRLLDPDELPGGGQALLVRSTAQPVAAPRAADLHAISSEDDWREYGQKRIAVEAGVGVDAAAAQRMVNGATSTR